MYRKAVSGIMLTLLTLSMLTFTFNIQPIKVRGSSYIEIRQSDFTLVSGLITQNTSWTADASPYVVVGDVCIDINVFLSIQPGVTVKFVNGMNLVVDGCLLAQGNSASEILFTSNNTAGATGDWGTINIRHYSTYTNRIEHVKIEYSSTALTLAADCNITASTPEHNSNGISLQNTTNVSVKDANITNNAGAGIDGSISQNIEIQSSNVSMNGAGVSISYGIENSPFPIVYVRDSTFDGNTGQGVSVGGTKQVDLRIDNCTVSGNGGGGVLTGARYVACLQLWNSNVSNNMGTGVAASGYTAPYSQNLIDVQNCSFWNNTIGMAIAGNAVNCDINGSSQYGVYAHFRDQGPSLHNCNISNSGLDGINVGYRSGCSVSKCNISNNKNGVSLVEGLDSVDIYDSTIRNNSDCGIIAEHGSISLQDSLIEQSQYGISGHFDSVQVSGCTIRNTAIGVIADVSGTLGASCTTIANNTLANIQCSSCTLEQCNVYNSITNIQCESGTFECCNVYNGTVGIKLGAGAIHYCNVYDNTEYNVENMAENDIDASHNWWGTTSEASINEYIYDFYDDFSLGRVLYKPYLTSPIDLSKATLTLKNVRTWYWTDNTLINSVTQRDVDADGATEIVTGGTYWDGTRDVAQLCVWDGATLALKNVKTWYWTGSTYIYSVAVGDVDGDSKVEIVTGGHYWDGTRDVAQLCVWDGATLALKNVQTWYWTDTTEIESVALGDVDADGKTEIVTGGLYKDGALIVAQLCVWNGATLALENVRSWYWTGHTWIVSVAVGDVDGDGKTEIVTGGCYLDDNHIVAQLCVWNGGTLTLENVQTWCWTSDTYISSVAVGNVDGDGQAEIVTGGHYYDVHARAQLCVWNGGTLGFEDAVSWYWTGDTYISSVAVGDTDGDGQAEIVTGGHYHDGARDVAQLCVWEGLLL